MSAVFFYLFFKICRLWNDRLIMEIILSSHEFGGFLWIQFLRIRNWMIRLISLEMARKLVAVGFFPYLCRNVFGISEFEFSLICAGVLVGFFCKGWSLDVSDTCVSCFGAHTFDVFWVWVWNSTQVNWLCSCCAESFRQVRFIRILLTCSVLYLERRISLKIY